MTTSTGANTDPIYSAGAAISSGANYNSGTVIGPNASTVQDGSTASNIYQIFQAGSNGSYLQKIRFRAVVSPAGTVARIYICSVTGNAAFSAGSTNTATNTWLYDEISLPSVTLSQTVQSPTFELNLGIALPGGSNGGYRVLVTFGTSTGSAGTGYSVVAVGGNY